MLDVHRLMVLRSVVETGSIQAAATHLGYTPSAISQHVAALQRETGTVLMERVGRGIQPTEAGRLLATHAGRIQSQIAEAETALADLRAGKAQRLVVRYFATAGAVLIPPIMAEFGRRFPGVHVELRLGKGLGNEGADAEIVVLPGTAAVPAGFRAVHLLDDPYAVVLPPGHRLAAQTEIELAQLSGEPWIDNEWPSTHCREIVLDACGAAGFSPHFAVEAHDYSTAVAFVAAGLGVTVLPRLALGAVPTDDLACRPVIRPVPRREIYVVVKEYAADHPALAAFVALLQEQTENR
ncbi:DNA-binding transcriptional regulator, LysR family [Nonomuraea solani]|uniref:DNA-binding transcriptional regulator, LysR family n=1 Tax=Nonomuraea solani TaxID=1144553 RepID=A0A1H6DVC0_9ACTN|nr:LysR family transcriptional regulator [Nonomuraea solani]SEG89322.1 DNA-binding transcriptional regulator, LysR family [Nonomuraea solani]